MQCSAATNREAVESVSAGRLVSRYRIFAIARQLGVDNNRYGSLFIAFLIPYVLSGEFLFQH